MAQVIAATHGHVRRQTAPVRMPEEGGIPIASIGHLAGRASRGVCPHVVLPTPTRRDLAETSSPLLGNAYQAMFDRVGGRVAFGRRRSRTPHSSRGLSLLCDRPRPLPEGPDLVSWRSTVARVPRPLDTLEEIRIDCLFLLSMINHLTYPMFLPGLRAGWPLQGQFMLHVNGPLGGHGGCGVVPRLTEAVPMLPFAWTYAQSAWSARGG